MVLTLERFNEVYKQLKTIDSSEFGNSEDDSIQEKMSSVFAQLSLDELDEFEKMLKERSTQRNLSAFFVLREEKFWLATRVVVKLR